MYDLSFCKGEVFGGGQVMNQPLVVGKMSNKAKARDNAMLAGKSSITRP
jgi:hypothetical protein